MAAFRMKGVSSTVWVLGILSLLNDTASDLVYPLVPLYLASMLGSGPAILGIIEGFAEATSSFFRLISGVVSDRNRYAKPWILSGYTLAAVARPMLAFARSWPMVLVLRVTDRMGKGLRSAPRDALLARSAAPNRRGIAFGFHRAMDNLGAFAGPLIASFLLKKHVPIEHIFLYTAIPGLLVVALTLRVHEDASTQIREKIGEGARIFAYKLSELPPAYRRYLVTLAIFGLGNSSNMFLLLKAHQLGISDDMVPLVWALMSLVAGLTSVPLSRWSDHAGREPFIVIGWSLYALCYLCLGWLVIPTVEVWLIFGAFGLYLAATEGAERALVAEMCDPEILGTAYGWFHAINGVTLLLASVLFGWVWQNASPNLAFTLAAGCAALAAFLLKVWVPKA